MNRMLRLSDIRGLIRSHLWAQILVAMVAAIVVGILLSPGSGSVFAVQPGQADNLGEWARLPGRIFLNMIQMVVVALVGSSIILGITSSSDPEFLKRAASRIVPYFVCTSVLAVLIGIAVAKLIAPGQYIDSTTLDLVNSASAAGTSGVAAMPEFSATDQIAELIPSNLLSAAVTKNMLQIVVAAVFTGIALMSLPADKCELALRLVQLVQDVSLKIVGWAMRLAPLAVFGLIMDFVLRVGLSALLGLSAYIATVITGLIILLLVYLLIVLVFAGRNPLKFAGQIADAQLLAFSTSSSAATMPLSLRIAEDRLRVSPPVSRFLIPLGATVNMDGTALYQVVAALFIAQLYSVDLSSAELAVLIFTVVGASIGSPSTPGVGIVILATILQGLGIPPDGAAILLGVDRILDMCRTSVNVSGDLTACVVMDKWLGERHAMPEAVH